MHFTSSTNTFPFNVNMFDYAGKTLTHTLYETCAINLALANVVSCTVIHNQLQTLKYIGTGCIVETLGF